MRDPLLVEYLFVVCYVLSVVRGTRGYFRVTAEELAACSARLRVVWLAKSAAVILLLVYVASRQEGRLDSIGLDLYRAADLAAGAALFVPAAMLFLFTTRIFGAGSGQEKKPAKYMAAMLGCKTRKQRSLYLGWLTLASVEEEVVFRGYLVLLWGARTGAIEDCAVVSGILFAASHIYQGRRAAAMHLLTAAILTAPVLITGSIMMSIGLHVSWNVLSTLAAWSGHDAKASGTSKGWYQSLCLVYGVFCVGVLVWQGERLGAFLDGAFGEGASAWAIAVFCAAAALLVVLQIRKDKAAAGTQERAAEGAVAAARPAGRCTRLAVAAMAASIFGLMGVVWVLDVIPGGHRLTLWPSGGVYGVYVAAVAALGVWARRRVRASGGRLEGSGLAAVAIGVSLLPAVGVAGLYVLVQAMALGMMLFMRIVVWLMGFALALVDKAAN